MLVKQVRSETPDVVTMTLVDPQGRALPEWAPGAHIEVCLPSGLRRQFSLCGDDRDRFSYRVAVLHEPGGRGGSREVHTTALVGRELPVTGPRNHFALAPAESYLLVAGGIGVTPLLAMARRLERTGASWRAVYCGRGPRPALADELRALAPERVTVVRTDREPRPDLAALVQSLPAGSGVYCCGPASLISDVVALGASRGPSITVRHERFAADPAAAPLDTATDRAFEVVLARSGTTVTVAADRTVLDAVRDVRPDLPSSCEEGYCGTCETTVLAGIPDHRDEVLGEQERALNTTMMICVGRARSSSLTLDL